MPTGQTYDKTLKQEAVQLVQTSGKSQRQVAEDLGVAMSTLSRWCSERAFVGSGNLQPEAEELRRFRRENDVLRQERDILKKRLPSSRICRRPFSLDRAAPRAI